MQINQNGFVYRTAYPFKSDRPTQVNLCWLPWRFVGLGLFRLVISLIMWLFFGGIFGLFIGTIALVITFLRGYKPIYHREFSPCKEGVFPIGQGLFNRIIPMNYESTPMDLPTIGGKPVQPILPVTIIVLLWLIWYIGPATVRLTIYAMQSAGSATMAWWNELIDGFARAAANEAGTILLWYVLIPLIILMVIWKLVGFFLGSEAGKLFLAYLKAKKEKVCPIIKVV